MFFVAPVTIVPSNWGPGRSNVEGTSISKKSWACSIRGCGITLVQRRAERDLCPSATHRQNEDNPSSVLGRRQSVPKMPRRRGRRIRAIQNVALHASPDTGARRSRSGSRDYYHYVLRQTRLMADDRKQRQHKFLPRRLRHRIRHPRQRIHHRSR